MKGVVPVRDRCRFGLGLIAVAAAVVACTHDQPAPKATDSGPPDTSVVAPTNDADRERLRTIQQIRGVDICALYGGARTVAGKALTIEAPTSPILCRSRIGQDSDNITATISLAVGPVVLPQPAAWAKHETIDGTDVTVADAFAGPNMPPRDQMVSAGCEWAATYPGSVRLTAMVMAPPRIDGCAIGRKLMQVGLHEFARKPSLATSSVPRTVITGADPCRAPARLRPAHGISWDIAEFSTHDCAFGVDGGPNVYLSLDYAEPDGLTYEPEHFDVGGHAVSGDGEAGIFTVVIGPQFQVGTKTMVPVATITDPAKDSDRIRLIAQAVADEY